MLEKKDSQFYSVSTMLRSLIFARSPESVGVTFLLCKRLFHSRKMCITMLDLFTANEIYWCYLDGPRDGSDGEGLEHFFHPSQRFTWVSSTSLGAVTWSRFCISCSFAADILANLYLIWCYVANASINPVPKWCYSGAELVLTWHNHGTDTDAHGISAGFWSLGKVLCSPS